MDLTTKNYKKDKTKVYLKTNNLFFIFNGINRNSIDKLITDQNIKNINFKYRKIKNKTLNLVIKKSIYCSVNSLIAGILFFVKPIAESQKLDKKILVYKFKQFFFFFTAIKLNNRLYSNKIVKNLNLLNYFDTNLLLFQTVLVTLKLFSRKLKNRNNVI